MADEAIAALSLRQTLPSNAFKPDRSRQVRQYLSQTTSKSLLDQTIKPEQLRVAEHVAASYDGTMSSLAKKTKRITLPRKMSDAM